jgi:GrpB-like predicted nucleotidyltransferase (UPF0157 family)
MTTRLPKPVVLAPYDIAWPETFAALKEVYAAALGELAQTIEHIGSTSVPGLTAKPIIDVDIVIASPIVLPDVIRGLSHLGYRHQGDQGVTGREAFARGGADDVPRLGVPRRWPAHNLYVCASDATELHRHLIFRDWLRAHPARAAEYGALKRQLAQIYRNDRDQYCEAKTSFIEAVILEASAP